MLAKTRPRLKKKKKRSYDPVEINNNHVDRVVQTVQSNSVFDFAETYYCNKTSCFKYSNKK